MGKIKNNKESNKNNPLGFYLGILIIGGAIIYGYDKNIINFILGLFIKFFELLKYLIFLIFSIKGLLFIIVIILIYIAFKLKNN